MTWYDLTYLENSVELRVRPDRIYALPAEAATRSLEAEVPGPCMPIAPQPQSLTAHSALRNTAHPRIVLATADLPCRHHR